MRQFHVSASHDGLLSWWFEQPLSSLSLLDDNNREQATFVHSFYLLHEPPVGRKENMLGSWLDKGE